MKKTTIRIFILLFIYQVLLTANLQAETLNALQYKRVFSDPDDIIPKEWVIIDRIMGDLNKDGIDDIVLLSRRRESLENLTSDAEDYYKISVMLKEAHGYTVLAENDQLASTGDEFLPDPLESGGIQINNGVLKIALHYWYSAGSWSVTNTEYIFRFQNHNLELIGYSSSSFHRASGEESSTSINYSTQKKKTITGGNMFDEELNKPKEQWEKINFPKLLKFQEVKIGSNLE